MLETWARLLRLLSLLQARRDWTSTELAARLGVTTRTIRNDMGRLRALGYPVDARPGVAGGDRLRPRGAPAPPPPAARGGGGGRVRGAAPRAARWARGQAELLSVPLGSL